MSVRAETGTYTAPVNGLHPTHGMGHGHANALVAVHLAPAG